MTDWTHFQKCDKCGAELGKACRSLSGFGPHGPISVEAGKPHGGRKPRAGNDLKGDR